MDGTVNSRLPVLYASGAGRVHAVWHRPSQTAANARRTRSGGRPHHGQRTPDPRCRRTSGSTASPTLPAPVRVLALRRRHDARRRGQRTLALMEALDAHEPSTPHLHLQLLGTRPEWLRPRPRQRAAARGPRRAGPREGPRLPGGHLARQPPAVRASRLHGGEPDRTGGLPAGVADVAGPAGLTARHAADGRRRQARSTLPAGVRRCCHGGDVLTARGLLP